MMDLLPCRECKLPPGVSGGEVKCIKRGCSAKELEAETPRVWNERNAVAEARP